MIGWLGGWDGMEWTLYEGMGGGTVLLHRSINQSFLEWLISRFTSIVDYID